MTFDEYIAYEKLIERMGKAKAMPYDQQDRYAKKIQELRTQLVDGFKGYFEFWITSGKNNLTEEEKEILRKFVGVRKELSWAILDGNLAEVHDALSDMRFILMRLQGKGFEMPNFKRDSNGDIADTITMLTKTAAEVLTVE